MTQEIIVYRNPGEKAFWDLIMSGDAIPVFAGILVFFVVLLVVNALSEKVIGGWRHEKIRSYFSMGAAIVAAIATVKYLWI